MAVNIDKHPSDELLFPWESPRRYNAYTDYLKARFGERLQKVIIDAGFTCPNRDGSSGYGGCTYCNNDAFTPPTGQSGKQIPEQLENGISYLSHRYGAGRFIAYFQPYSNTYAPLSRLKELYEQALSHPAVVGLSIGTRPDCIDEEKIKYLESLARDYYISVEYGLESPYDKTLDWINRQHDFRCWEEAVTMTANRGIDICTHIILGFPTESREEMLDTATTLSDYPLDSLKIHHLHIVKKTVLAKRYKEEPFHLFDFPEYMDLVIGFLERLNPEIKIQRLSGETQPGMLVAPNWGGLRADAIQRRLESELTRRNTWQGRLLE